MQWIINLCTEIGKKLQANTIFKNEIKRYFFVVVYFIGATYGQLHTLLIELQSF